MNYLKLAIKKMLEDGEFEKIIKNAPNSQERKRAKNYYEFVKVVFSNCENVSSIILTMECKSYFVWQDIMSYISLIISQERSN